MSKETKNGNKETKKKIEKGKTYWLDIGVPNYYYEAKAMSDVNSDGKVDMLIVDVDWEEDVDKLPKERAVDISRIFYNCDYCNYPIEGKRPTFRNDKFYHRVCFQKLEKKEEEKNLEKTKKLK
ncbi:MAG: hypothetical protein ACYCQJ_10450 [Nitrososphaerales archaeon]